MSQRGGGHGLQRTLAMVSLLAVPMLLASSVAAQDLEDGQGTSNTGVGLGLQCKNATSLTRFPFVS